MDDELRCSVCQAVVTELRQTLAAETPRQNLDLRTRVGSDGKRKGKVVAWKASESRATDMLEEVCDQMKMYVLMEVDDDNNRSGRRGYFKPEGNDINMLPYYKDIKKTAASRQNMKVMCQATVEAHEETLTGFLSQEPSRLQPLAFCTEQRYCIPGVDFSPAGSNDGRFAAWDKLTARFVAADDAMARQGTIAELSTALRMAGGPFRHSGTYCLHVMQAIEAELADATERGDAAAGVADTRFLAHEVEALLEEAAKGKGKARKAKKAKKARGLAAASEPPSVLQRLAIAAQFGGEPLRRSANQKLWGSLQRRSMRAVKALFIDDGYWDSLTEDDLKLERPGRTPELEEVAAVFVALPAGSGGQMQLLRLMENALSACDELGACDAALVPQYAALMARIVRNKGVGGIKKEAKKFAKQMKKRRKDRSAEAVALQATSAEKLWVVPCTQCENSATTLNLQAVARVLTSRMPFRAAGTYSLLSWATSATTWPTSWMIGAYAIFRTTISKRSARRLSRGNHC